MATGRPLDLVAALGPAAAALVALQASGSWLVALIVAVAGYLLAWLLTRQAT
jgi:hypothetical protein